MASTMIRLTKAQDRMLREVVATGECVYGGRRGIAAWNLKLLGLVTVSVRYVEGAEQISEEWTVRPTDEGKSFAGAAPTPQQGDAING